MTTNINSQGPTMGDVFVLGFKGVLAVVRFAFYATAWIAIKSWLLVEKAAGKKSAEESQLAKAQSQKAAVQRKFESAGVVTSTPQKDDFIAADRIVSIRLDPPVAVLNLRLYYKQQIVKREMIVSEQRLRTLMQGRHHSLGEVRYDPTKLEDIKDETVRLAQELINRTGAKMVKPTVAKVEPRPAETQKPKETVAKKAADPKPVESKPAPTPAPQREPKVQPTPVVAQPPSKSFVPRPTVGVTFEGQLVRAGSRRFTPEGRAPYETFEASLKLDNGVDVPLRGAELERELQRFNVKIGERVAITPMGKVPVTLPSGDEGSKNVYRVARLQGA
jgi:hypothetical protein